MRTPSMVVSNRLFRSCRAYHMTVLDNDIVRHTVAVCDDEHPVLVRWPGAVAWPRPGAPLSGCRLQARGNWPIPNLKAVSSAYGLYLGRRAGHEDLVVANRAVYRANEVSFHCPKLSVRKPSIWATTSSFWSAVHDAYVLPSDSSSTESR